MRLRRTGSVKAMSLIHCVHSWPRIRLAWTSTLAHVLFDAASTGKSTCPCHPDQRGLRLRRAGPALLVRFPCLSLDHHFINNCPPQDDTRPIGKRCFFDLVLAVDDLLA